MSTQPHPVPSLSRYVAYSQYSFLFSISDYQVNQEAILLKACSTYFPVNTCVKVIKIKDSNPTIHKLCNHSLHIVSPFLTVDNTMYKVVVDVRKEEDIDCEDIKSMIPHKYLSKTSNGNPAELMLVVCSFKLFRNNKLS